MALKIISGLESVEEQMGGKGVKFLQVDVNDVSEITVSAVPSLVYFKNGEPFVYEGNMFTGGPLRTEKPPVDKDLGCSDILLRQQVAAVAAQILSHLPNPGYIH